MLGYLALFSIAFLSATLLPLQSELVLLAMLGSGKYMPWLLIVVASVGNVLGSVVNWWMGKALLHFQHRRWFPFKAQSIARAAAWYQRWGQWTLLASWMPVIGDPLTLIAGVMGMKLWRFLILVIIAKTTRYLIFAQLIAF